jgi:hypothetical protein
MDEMHRGNLALSEMDDCDYQKDAGLDSPPRHY